MTVFVTIEKQFHGTSSRFSTVYNKLWCGAQQTPPPAATYATDLLTPVLCCHLTNATDSDLWPVITNNLTFDPPTRTELTQNWIRSSHGHSAPSLKISCKSVQPFSPNVADKETNKKRNRAKQNPFPRTGGGVMKQTNGRTGVQNCRSIQNASKCVAIR